MDIFAHTLWTNIAARKVNQTLVKKQQPKISLGWMTFWGIFPDLAAFTYPFAIRFLSVLVGELSLYNFFLLRRPPVSEEAVFSNGFNVTAYVYPFSHSIIIFGLVFIIAWIIWRRPRFELLGWALHIIIDIFTHSAAFYPTPFLFPISDWRFLYGVAWREQWLMIVNYSALLLVWSRLLWQKYFSKLN